MSNLSTTAVGAPSKTRAKLTNNPAGAGRHGQSAEGRRVRDLYRAFVAQLGNPTDAGVQAAVLAAAENVVIAEQVRALFLAGAPAVSASDVVRAESTSNRSQRRLGLHKPAQKPAGPTLQDIKARYIRPPIEQNAGVASEAPANETRISDAPSGHAAQCSAP
jgi:hypothetical protein